MAQPPFAQESVIGQASIIYPKEEAFKVNQNISLHFHFANSSNYVLNNSMFDCIGHVYDVDNTEFLIVNLTNDGFYDKQLDINASYLNAFGVHNYNVWCNSSQGEYAFTSQSFLVNPTGDLSINNSWLSLILALVLLGGFLIVTSFIIRNDKLEMVKILLFVYGILSLFAINIVIYVLTFNPDDIKAFQPVAEGLVIVYGIGFLAFVFMYGYHLVINIGKNGKKRDDDE